VEVLPSMIFASLILLGLIPASIARHKGHSMVRWWIYGTLLFPVALIHAFLLHRMTQADEKVIPDNKKQCMYCKELLSMEDETCPSCLLRQFALDFDSREHQQRDKATQ
jgi:RNA polymerase subunit RPABC4/transcription elongation factor Spt4